MTQVAFDEDRQTASLPRLAEREKIFSEAKRLRGRAREEALEEIIKRDGPACRKCGRTDRGLTIDHIGDPELHSLSNLQGLCFICNASKGGYKRQKDRQPKQSDVWEREKIRNSIRGDKQAEAKKDATEQLHESVDYQQGSPEMVANDFAEIEFRNWLRAYVRSHGSISREKAIADGAELFGVSPNTSRRYLLKITSDAGPLKQVKDEETKKWIIIARVPDIEAFKLALSFNKISQEELRRFRDQVLQSQKHLLNPEAGLSQSDSSASDKQGPVSLNSQQGGLTK
jgi:hypothetical protein